MTCLWLGKQARKSLCSAALDRWLRISHQWKWQLVKTSATAHALFPFYYWGRMCAGSTVWRRMAFWWESKHRILCQLWWPDGYCYLFMIRLCRWRIRAWGVGGGKGWPLVLVTSLPDFLSFPTICLVHGLTPRESYKEVHVCVAVLTNYEWQKTAVSARPSPKAPQWYLTAHLGLRTMSVLICPQISQEDICTWFPISCSLYWVVISRTAGKGLTRKVRNGFWRIRRLCIKLKEKLVFSCMNFFFRALDLE
jgi:hypothetical protein